VLNNINQWLATNGLADTLPALVSSAMRVILIVLIGWLVLRFLKRSISGIGEHIVKHRESPGSVRRTKTLTRVMSNIASVAVFVIAVLIILGEFGVSVAPILGAAGVVGIAVGFGAQTLVKDLKLRDYEGNVHFVPNSNITTVTNMSRDFAFAVMDISVGYSEDTDQVIDVLRAVANDMRKDPTVSTSILEDLERAGRLFSGYSLPHKGQCARSVDGSTRIPGAY